MNVTEQGSERNIMSNSTNPSSRFESQIRQEFDEAGIRDGRDPVWEPESIDGLVAAITAAAQTMAQEAELRAYEKALRYAIGAEIDPKWLRKALAALAQPTPEEGE